MMVPSSNLFFLEFVVNSLALETQPSDEDSAAAAKTAIKDTCVVLTFQDVRMEICAKDYGLPLPGFESDQRVKAGNSCLFVPKAGDVPLEMTVSAFEKQAHDEKALIGSAVTDLTEIFAAMTKKYNDQMQTTASPRSSIRDSVISGASNRALKSFRQSLVQPAVKMPPVTSMVKRMYRLQGPDGGVKAVLEALLRVTCFGPSISTQFRVGSQAKMVPLPLAKEDDDEAEPKEPKCPFGCKSLLLPPLVEKTVKVIDCDEVYQELEEVAAPPGSKTNVCEDTPYTEYSAEMNGNALVIRVPKGANLTTKVVSDEKLPEPVIQPPAACPFCWCAPKPQQPFAENTCGLPPIHGNLKYPTIDGCKGMTYPKDQRNVCLQCDTHRQIVTEPADPKISVVSKDKSAGIEICRKGWHDRSTDVFVLKLGKRSNGEADKHALELELRTPKNPDCIERFKVTKQVQVDEDEFAEMGTSKAGGPKKAGKGGKKGGKGKGKKKK